MKFALVISVSKTKFGPVVFRGNLIENIKKAKNLGYDGVEFAIRETNKINPLEIIKTTDMLHLEIPAIGTGQIYLEEGLSFSSRNKDVRNKAVKRINEITKIASYFNSSVIIGLVRGNIETISNKKEMETAESRIAECLEKCMRYSEKYGTEYLIEPLIRYDSNILNKIEDVKIFIDKYKNKFDVERIGVLADTFHMNVEESIIADSFLNNMKIVKHIHFTDSNRYAPGEGHINFKEIIGILKSNNYSKYISFEMLPEPDSETAAKRAITYVKNII